MKHSTAPASAQVTHRNRRCTPSIRWQRHSPPIHHRNSVAPSLPCFLWPSPLIIQKVVSLRPRSRSLGLAPNPRPIRITVSSRFDCFVTCALNHGPARLFSDLALPISSGSHNPKPLRCHDSVIPLGHMFTAAVLRCHHDPRTAPRPKAQSIF